MLTLNDFVQMLAVRMLIFIVSTMHSGQHILMNLILIMLMINIGMLTDSVSTCKIRFRQYIYT